MLREATQRLLHSISSKDWYIYTSYVDPSVTCFEPEVLGHLVQGLDFHKFYFNLEGVGNSNRNSNKPSIQNTIVRHHFRFLDDMAAVIPYTRCLVVFVGRHNNIRLDRDRQCPRSTAIKLFGLLGCGEGGTLLILCLLLCALPC